MVCIEIRTLERKIASVEPDKRLFLPNTRSSAVTEKLSELERVKEPVCQPENALMTWVEPTRVT